MTDTLAAPLKGQDYSVFYDHRKAASSMWPESLQYLRDHVAALVPEGAREVSVLSVGSGEGDFDLEIVRVLQSRVAKIRLVAVEPIERFARLFEERLAALNLGDALEVEVFQGLYHSGDDKGFDPAGRSFDIVSFIHSLYFFPDSAATVNYALSHTKPTGCVLILHQSSRGIPEIQKRHMKELKGDQGGMLNTDEIIERFDKAAVRYQYTEREAFLDITEVLNETDIGMMIMSFTMNSDLRPLKGSDKYRRVLASFTEKALDAPGGGKRLQENVGIFVCPKAAP